MTGTRRALLRALRRTALPRSYNPVGSEFLAMLSQTSETHAEPPSLRRFRGAYWFGGFNGLTWMMGLGTPMVLLTEQLGGSAFQVGLASSFVLLLFPLQVLATSVLPYFGFRRQMVLAWSARAVFLLIPLGLAFRAPEVPADWMPGAVVFSVFGFCVFRAFGVAAHIPWYAAILPDSLRGRFFATDSAITSGVGVATLFTCAFIFAQLPTYPAFQAAYGIAVFGSAMAVLNLGRLPKGPVPPASPLNQISGHTLRLTLGAGVFRQYLIVSALWLITTLPIQGFAAYYLKVTGQLTSSEILAYTGVQFIGQIVGTTGIRRLIDRIAIKRFFQVATAIVIATSLLWLGVLSDGERFAPLIWLAYVIFGVGVGISQAAHFTFLPELAPPEERPVTIAIFGAVSGVLGGLAPMFWGLALRSEGSVPGMDLGAFALFFYFVIGASVLAIGLLNSLPDSRTGLADTA